MEYTAEPWFVVSAPWGNGTWINAGSADPHGGQFVADFLDTEQGCWDEQAQYNARRAVACVNVCEGLDTALLEKIVAHGGTLKRLKDALAKVGAGITATEGHNGEVRGASRLAGEASSREAATSTVVLEGGKDNGDVH